MASTTAAAVRPASNAILRDRPRFTVGRFFFWVLIVVILIYTIFPFYWAVITSFTPQADVFLTPVSYWPSHFTSTTTQQLSLEGTTEPLALTRTTGKLFNHIVTV